MENMGKTYSKEVKSISKAEDIMMKNGRDESGGNTVI